jgi:hypothetical protein
MEKFGLRFGQKLREINFVNPYKYHYKTDDINKYKKLLRLCPNLVSLGDKYIFDLSLFVDSNELLMPKLSRIATKVESKNIELFETFAKNYGNSLKKVLILADFDLKDNEINVLMKQIIHLKNFKELEFCIDFVENRNEEFIDGLKAIAIHCNQLKSFKINVVGINTAVTKHIFNCLGFFKNLNHLELSSYKNNEESDEISCESLKELKLLTHLKTSFSLMNDIFFSDIDKHLPQLKHLSIHVNDNITDKSMNSLSKLLKLQSIKIEKFSSVLPLITDSGLIDVINNCPQINSIIFNSRTNITHKTIDALIALALRKPRIQFKHKFYGYYISTNGFVSKKIYSRYFQLPNNLVLYQF